MTGQDISSQERKEFESQLKSLKAKHAEDMEEAENTHAREKRDLNIGFEKEKQELTFDLESRKTEYEQLKQVRYLLALRQAAITGPAITGQLNGQCAQAQAQAKQTCVPRCWQ